MKKIFFLAFIALASLTARAQAPNKYEMAYDDTIRTYSMYIPENIKPGAPLVVYTHGYGSKKRWLKDLNKVAEANGFAVCYPDGAPDTRGKDGWYVGYPPQSNMKQNEEDFFAALLDTVCQRFKLSRDNVFMAGMSNGGDLCYQLAYTRPELFRAYASVAGLTFEWMYNSRRLTIPVPFMEIHGNADTTSAWQGDHENKGGWGAYIPVPLAVAAVAANNRCATVQVDKYPSMSDSTRMVTRTIYADAPSGMDVVVYEIEGGKHSWHAKDVNTSQLIWDFFSAYLKKD